MWLALPDEVEESDPTFQHIKAAQLATVDLTGGSARIAIGTAWDATAPTTTHSDTIFADLNIAPGGNITIEPAWEERALILLEGDAALNDRSMKAYDLPILDPFNHRPALVRYGRTSSAIRRRPLRSRPLHRWQLCRLVGRQDPPLDDRLLHRQLPPHRPVPIQLTPTTKGSPRPQNRPAQNA